jgi:hypothetical protein
MIPDIELLAEKSPMTAALRKLVQEADFYQTISQNPNPYIRKALREPVVAATDPWAEVMYQSLYLTDDKEDRIVLQEPATQDPTVGILVLKAARIQGESGMVFCGSEEHLQSFISKLPEFEERGEELDEKEFLECLSEAAEAEGLKIIYKQLSPEHGGDLEAEDSEY